MFCELGKIKHDAVERIVNKKGPVTQLIEDVIAKNSEIKDLKDKYLRALADWDNFRKRMEKEFDEFRKFARVDFLTKIVPILDNFNRALSSAELNAEFDNFYKGMVIIERQLKDTLKAIGLSEYSGLGEQFDPAIHEAVGVIDTDDKPENTVVEEISKGYKIGERVIRPAMVLVSKRKEGG